MRRLLSFNECPASLQELEDPPKAIWLEGELPDLSRTVAIVGTRRADALAVSFTRQLAGELAQAGYVIVSGGAAGIDTAAHEGALAAQGKTVAVLPYDWPTARNHQLFQQIASTGALLSEHFSTPPPGKVRPLVRNRLIAALGQVVIVAQAPYQSGAMSTAAHASKLGRPLMAVPHAPWEVRGEGCLRLLAEGARVCRSSRDVLSLAAPSGVVEPPTKLRGPKKSEKNQDLDDDERGVLGALFGSPRSADELCEQTGMSAPRVQRAILMLLLSGVIQEVGCGRYARIGL